MARYIVANSVRVGLASSVWQNPFMGFGLVVGNVAPMGRSYRGASSGS